MSTAMDAIEAAHIQAEEAVNTAKEKADTVIQGAKTQGEALIQKAKEEGKQLIDSAKKIAIDATTKSLESVKASASEVIEKEKNKALSKKEEVVDFLASAVLEGKI